MDQLMQERVEQERDERGRGPEADEIFGARSAVDALLVLTKLLGLAVAASGVELERRKGLASIKSRSPLRGFVVEAGRMFLLLSGRKRLLLSRDWDTGGFAGPLIPFLRACCRQVGVTQVSSETLAIWVWDARPAAEAAPPI